MPKIVVLGNGIAGITAAREIRKRSDDEILVISGESDHFFSRTALMYIYMGHMTYENTKPYEDWFWEKNRIRLLRAWVRQLDPGAKLLHLANGGSVAYDVLILATGSKSNKFGWPGQDLDGVQGLYGLQDLSTMEESTRGIDRALVVGGGLIGIEMVEMLRSREIPVTFLVREKKWMDFVFPPEEAEMVGRHIAEHGVDLRLATELERIEDDGNGRVRAAFVKGTGDEISCGFLGLTVGVSPNVDFLRDVDGAGLEIERGILVDDHLRTSVPDVYAIGDCAQVREPAPGRRPVEALWYVGRRMGQTVARTICGESTPYDPGLWFNSAKFMDIEYQVYGKITAQPGDGEASLYWEHADGMRSIRLQYREEDLRILGFNLMGVRYRHETCHQWITEGRDLPYVLENLGAANFDPEFYAQHEQELVRQFNERYPDRAVALRKKRGLAGWWQLRKPSVLFGGASSSAETVGAA
ncbi:MAG: FAD-dependent oxidoreductase [Thermoanaerobaculia bacterium]|nr:FAD-dependent oxidoreductase [Thermoanaerobaculia bacterium]